MPELLNTCESAARLGGQVLLDWAGRVTVREKGPADLVTEADLAAQRAVQKTIADAFGDHLFVGEEPAGGVLEFDAAINSDQYVWLVDPLDGTTNYVHGVPHYACSVAVVRHGVGLAAAIFNPVTNECYTAAQGQGAFLNGTAIRASDVEDISRALVAVSFPPRVGTDSRAINELLKVIEVAQAIRRTGSAALNLCYVAAGRYDAYWATETKAWDVAAGYLLVQEAGGVVTALDGTNFRLDEPLPVAAGTAALNRQLLGILGRN